MKIAGLILAAGESKRLGTTKQLLTYLGNSLIFNSVYNCRNLDLNECIVVTGKDRALILEELKDEKYIELYNANYKLGMLNSLKKGIEYCEANNFDAALIMLVDQYLIPQQHFQKLIETAQNNDQDIVCSSYGINFGAPTVFKSSMFKHLLHLKLGHSAKFLISENLSSTLKIECPEAEIDIDHPSDLDVLYKMNKRNEQL